MATRTVESCDLCHEDIRDGARRIRLSAQRWDSEYPYGQDGPNIVNEFKMATFCGERCALAAVRGLCN
jgi:hypothetical protein